MGRLAQPTEVPSLNKVITDLLTYTMDLSTGVLSL